MLIDFRNISRLSAISCQLSAISCPSQCLEIDLPLSKSESNRALMILHYAKSQFTIVNEQLTIGQDSGIFRFSDFQIPCLSDSDDTILLHQLLNKINDQNLLSVDGCPLAVELDCCNAGTVFRFLLTAVTNLQLTINNEQLTVDSKKTSQLPNFPTSQFLRFLLTGSERMKSRPVDSLVDALRSLGASIEYTEREGYPPVLLTVNSQQSTANSRQSEFPIFNSQFPISNRVEVSVEQSSQFASSLLLAAPTWKNGLELHLTGNLSSLPYIDMTINMMRQCGIDVERKDRDIVVKPGRYNVENIKIEPDWSAAAFWYEAVALSTDSSSQPINILLKNLNINSLQGDSVVMKMFETLGVETIPSDKGVIVRKTTRQRDNETTSCGEMPIANSQQLIFNFQLSTFNFKDCPDLFPAVIATCAGLQIDATFTGLKNLSIKESDRKEAMMNELNKINISFESVSDDVLIMHCPEKLPYFTEENPIIFNNYGDHRIAMALSVLSLKIGMIEMENQDVVSKSYPGFFESTNIHR